MTDFEIHHGNALDVLRAMPAESVQCCVTSPPYYGLRSYKTVPQVWDNHNGCDHEWKTQIRPAANGLINNVMQGETLDGNSATRSPQEYAFCASCSAWRGELGLEPTFQLYISHLIQIFAEVRRVLKKDGVCFVNLGDSYTGSGKGGQSDEKRSDNWAPQYPKIAPVQRSAAVTKFAGESRTPNELQPKSLMNIPARFAIAMTDELGFVQRNELIWHKPACLRGSTVLYAKTQKGIITSSLRELRRLDPSTVQLWDGEKWNQVLQWLPNENPQNLLAVTLRNGEVIHSTGEHLFPVNGQNIRADQLKIGDVIQSCLLPDADHTPAALPDELGWLVGLYLAEGSWDKTQIAFRIASHSKELDRYDRVKAIAERFGGSCSWRVETGQSATITVYSRVLSAIIQEYVSGRNARVKRLTNKCWKRNNTFLAALLQGYLDGDGHYDVKNERWRLGFTRNERLASDLQTIAARLGYAIKLQRTVSACNGLSYKSFKGELRQQASGHHNCRAATEIVSIARDKNSGGYFDIVLASEPHLFATAGGTLIHNCMPSSAKDRWTVDFEPIYFFAKGPKYKFNQRLEPLAAVTMNDGRFQRGEWATNGRVDRDYPGQAQNCTNLKPSDPQNRNARTTMTIPFEPSSDPHFASYPTKLVEPLILAGSDEGDTVLDIFAGTGTTLLTALRHRRRALGIDLNPDYIEIAQRRLAEVQVKLF